jgi:hypothetical protein
MNYAFNDRDLRVKKDVSDLELDPLFSQVIGLIHQQQFSRCRTGLNSWTESLPAGFNS